MHLITCIKLLPPKNADYSLLKLVLIFISSSAASDWAATVARAIKQPSNFCHQLAVTAPRPEKMTHHILF